MVHSCKENTPSLLLTKHAGKGTSQLQGRDIVIDVLQVRTCCIVSVKGLKSD